MGLDGLSNLQEGGQMQEHEGDQPDVPKDEMTKDELEAAGGTPAPDTSPPEDRPDDSDNGDGDGDGEDDSESEPKPVDDPDLPEDGDQDEFQPEPIPSDDFEQGELSDHGESREDPADLSGVEKEFED